MIYFDYNATYPCSLDHCNKVTKALVNNNANPSSTHAMGRRAKHTIEVARSQVALLLGAKPASLFFNSGATEANNTVIYEHINKINNPVVAISAGEHPSIVSAVKYFKDKGLCQVEDLALTSRGQIDLEFLKRTLESKNITAIFLHHVNNETGSVNPIKDIIDVVKSESPATYLHFDMVQSLGKLDLTWVSSSLVDSVSLSAHKVGGFKGVGALYQKKSSKPEFPLFIGGLQENGMRAGTENLPGVISFGIKAEEIKTQDPWKKVAETKKYFLSLIEDLEIKFNLDPRLSVLNTLSIYIEGLEANQILLQAEQDGIQISSKSACSSGLAKPSAVLLAMGFSEKIAANSIRISFGPESSLSEVDSLAKLLRSLSAKTTKKLF
jgi:cysteine desulfurase